jgi:hypothetical protein
MLGKATEYNLVDEFKAKNTPVCRLIIPVNRNLIINHFDNTEKSASLACHQK